MKYLASSPEMQIFLRPKLQVIASLNALQIVTTTHVLKYYHAKLPINAAPQCYGEARINTYNQ